MSACAHTDPWQPGGWIVPDVSIQAAEIVTLSGPEMSARLSPYLRSSKAAVTAVTTPPARQFGPCTRVAFGVLAVALVPFALVDMVLARRERSRG